MKYPPRPLAPTLDAANSVLRERAMQVVSALSNGKKKAELTVFSPDKRGASRVLAGNNGNRVWWTRVEYEVQLKVCHVSRQELDLISRIIGPAIVEDYMVQSYSVNRVHLDLCISVRISDERS